MASPRRAVPPLEDPPPIPKENPQKKSPKRNPWPSPTSEPTHPLPPSLVPPLGIGGWVHAVAEDAHIYSFDVEKGELAHLLKVGAT